MAKIFEKTSIESTTSTSSKFDNYLNIELEVAPGKKIRMPLNCAIPLDDRGLSEDQKKLRDLLLSALDKIEEAQHDGASKEEVEYMSTIKIPIHATLYRRKSETSDTSDWTLGI